MRTILFAIFLINGFFYIPAQSITGDEGDHFNYAVRFVKGHPEKVKPFDDASTMPLSSINTIPRIVEQLIHPAIKKYDNGETDIINGRYLSLFACMLIGLVVYRWSRELYGDNAALLSLFFFCFCPNINAHGSLVTTDAFSALFTILPAWYFWKFSKSGAAARFLWFCCWLTIAQLAKQSLTWLYPIFVLLGMVVFLSGNPRPELTFRRAGFLFIIFVFSTITILNIGFQFNETGKSLRSYQFTSKFFSSLPPAAGFLADIPLPLPKPFLQGLDYTKAMDEMGGGHPESSGNIYLLGESRSGRGFNYYYFVVGFFKTPVPLLLAIALSMLIIAKRGLQRFMSNEIFLVFPVICFLVYFNFFYRSQVGLRHILMIYPLLFVLAGNIFTQKNRIIVYLIPGLLIWSVASFYFFFPHLIPYTNEFILDKKSAFRIMADSNLDYDQAAKYREKYLMSHADVQYAPENPAAGKFLIRTTDLLDLDNLGKYQWLRTNFKPVDHLVFTYLIYNIQEQDLRKLNLK